MATNQICLVMDAGSPKAAFTRRRLHTFINPTKHGRHRVSQRARRLLREQLANSSNARLTPAGGSRSPP
jgi:hypothetical protein